MSAKLLPTDVLQRRGEVQIAEIGDGRLIIRHRDGVSVLRKGLRGDIEAVLALVDGQRDVAAVETVLSERAVKTLHSLVGDVLERAPAALPGRVLVLSNGSGGELLARRLQESGVDGVTVSPDFTIQGAPLVVALLEGFSYGKLFDLQERAELDSVPILFLTPDADGVRVGPTVLPGSSSCLGCAQYMSFSFLRIPEGALLSSLAKMRTLRWEDLRGTDAALDATVREVRRILDPVKSPDLAATVVRYGAGDGTPYPVVPHLDCPLCIASPSPDVAAQVVEALERRPPRAAPPADELIRSVLVLGGGTAGHLTALALRKKLPHLDVTLVESSAVPVVGVGEATTPLLPQFLHADLELPVEELFREVAPTLKLGIRFEWGGPGADGAFNYPFGPLHVLDAVQAGDLGQASLQSMLMTAGRVPVLDVDGVLLPRFDTEMAYHLDNRRLVAYLKRRAAEAGVEPVDATIADVETEGEEVHALVADDGRRFAADLFVDCSGFAALLVDGTLGSPFLSFADSLFTDRALVAVVPHDGAVRPYTTAEAMPAGWCWATPQRDADHRGYVFSSAFASAEEAEAEMRRRFPGMAEPRLVRFRAGRHEHFWKGNVVAVGNAYGFVEPLESTALHMLVKEIGELVRAFPLRRGERSTAALLNRRMGAAWDYLRWFLALHFKFNRRMETPFWQACRETVDVTSHGELLERFAERGPLSYDPAARRDFDYPDPLWGPEGIDTVLLGQQVAARLPSTRTPRPAWERRIELCRLVVERSLEQRAALAAVDERPSLLAGLEAAFRQRGKAFL